MNQQQQQPSASFSLDRDAAIKGSGAARINQKGAYTGTVTRAEFIKSAKGTTGIDLSFVADDGAQAEFLTIWTHNKDGDELSGYNLVQSLMTCVRAEQLCVRRARIEKYNADTRAREPMDADIYPDLMNKPVGLLLVVEQYLSNTNNQVKDKMTIVGCYEAKTGKTAKEMWEKKPSTMLPTLIAGLHDKPLKTGAAGHSANGHGGYGQDSGPPSAIDFDDDIPF